MFTQQQLDEFSLGFLEFYMMYENIHFDDTMSLIEILEIYKKIIKK